MDYSHMIGASFGRLVVKGQTGSADRLVCLCKCGVEKIARLIHLRYGSVKSCGCLLVERPKEVHGTYLASRTPEYRAWYGMVARCHSLKHPAYKNYGGRGITVCDGWRGPTGFGNFASDMGPRPHGTTLDRIDNEKGYMPGNCRWVDMQVQANNRRGNIRFVSRGKTMTLAEWSRETGISDKTMRERIKRGWDAERAIHTPVIKE